ncbi:MAG: addiction module protein [Chitinophagaceae bacterium]
MPVNLNSLLELPQNERRKIAEKLWNSLSPAQSISKEEKEIINLLEKRWKNMQEGRSKLYSPKKIRKLIEEYRQ